MTTCPLSGPRARFLGAAWLSALCAPPAAPRLPWAGPTEGQEETWGEPGPESVASMANGGESMLVSLSR